MTVVSVVNVCMFGCELLGVGESVVRGCMCVLPMAVLALGELVVATDSKRAVFVRCCVVLCGRVLAPRNREVAVIERLTDSKQPSIKGMMRITDKTQSPHALDTILYCVCWV